MNRNPFPSQRDDAFHGLPHCHEHLFEYGSCKMMDKGCKFFHKGIDCIQQFRSHDCSGGCRYEHRKIMNDDDHRGSLKRKAEAVSDARSSRDERDRTAMDSLRRADPKDSRDGPRDGRDPRDHRDVRDRDPRVNADRDTRPVVRDPRDVPRDARDPRDVTRDTRDPRDVTRDTRDPRDVTRDARDPREMPREVAREVRDAPREPLRESRDPRVARDLRDPGREKEREREVDREANRVNLSKVPSRDADPRQRELERGDESKSKKIKLDDSVDSRMAPKKGEFPVRDDRYPPKRPFEREIPGGRHSGQIGHDIFIPAAARNPRNDSFPRDRDLGRDPRDFRDGGRPFYPDEPQVSRTLNKKIQGYNQDRPLPNYNANFPPIDPRDRDRGLPPRIDRGDARQEMLNRIRERGIPNQDRLPDRRFDGIGERDRYVSDFPDDRNRAPIINDDPYRARREQHMEDLRGPPPRTEFNRGGMRGQNDIGPDAARMRLNRGNDPRADFPRVRDMGPGMRDMPMNRDGPQQHMQNDYPMGAGREMFASRFRERVEMKTGLDRDSWQPQGRAPMDLHKVRDEFHSRANSFNNAPPQGDLRQNNPQGIRSFDDRNMPIRGDAFQRGDIIGRPGQIQDRLREPVRHNFGNNAPIAAHPFASRVHSFAERNNMEPNLGDDKRRELRDALPSANFRNRDDPRDRNIPIRHHMDNNRFGNREWQPVQRNDRGVDESIPRRDDNSIITEPNQNSDSKKEVTPGESGDKEKQEQVDEEEEEERKEDTPAQPWDNVHHVLSKLNIFENLVGSNLYDHITQIKKERCQVKEQANKKIIAERTLAAKIMKEATGGDAEEDYPSVKTDLSISGDLKGDKMNDEMDGEENMDYIENGERLFDEYFYNLQQIQNIPNISEIVFTQFCNPMKVAPT